MPVAAATKSLPRPGCRGLSRAIAICLLLPLAPLLAGQAPEPQAGANGPIVIAVVDDAFRLDDREIEAFLWRRTQEVPWNGLDDDGNGYVDDHLGWDVADGDGDVTPPAARDDLHHGSSVARAIARTARELIGEEATQRIRILPIKTVSDASRDTRLTAAFAGIEYAMAADADVVLCAWGVGELSPDELALLGRAAAQRMLLVASAGNMPDGREQFPAAHPPALAVAAVDRAGTPLGNYGVFVDLAAPGHESAGPADAPSGSGDSSTAAAVVAATAAVAWSRNPGLGPREVTACLKGGTRLLEPSHPRFQGTLGAGLLDPASAGDCSMLKNATLPGATLRKPQGYLRAIGKGTDPLRWRLAPTGQFEGISLRPVFDRSRNPGGSLTFISGDQHRSFKFRALPVSLRFPDQEIEVVFDPGVGDGFDWLIEYTAEPIDLPRRFCSGEQIITEPGTFSDGSGSSAYSFDTDCKWLIQAPPGALIDVRFESFATEARVDWVYLFDGAGTHDKIIAAFSGSEIPPAVRSWGNEMLLWFVTDGDRQADGWRAEVRFVEVDSAD